MCLRRAAIGNQRLTCICICMSRSCQKLMAQYSPDGCHDATGMAADEAIMARVKRTGLGLLTPATGLSALAAVLTHITSPATHHSLLAAVPVVWPTLLKPRPGLHIPSFFAEFEIPDAGMSAPIPRGPEHRASVHPRRRKLRAAVPQSTAATASSFEQNLAKVSKHSAAQTSLDQTLLGASAAIVSQGWRLLEGNASA